MASTIGLATNAEVEHAISAGIAEVPCNSPRIEFRSLRSECLSLLLDRQSFDDYGLPNAVREQVRQLKGHTILTADLVDFADPDRVTITDADVFDDSSDELFSHLTNRAVQFVRESVDANT